ncbi:MAG: hypothetical protein AB7E52_01280 [Bdellovibrionales bacterium]
MRIVSPQNVSLANARIVAPLSMARITQGQTAANTLRVFTDILPPYLGEPTNDVSLLLTTDLYLHNAQEPAATLYDRLLQNNLSFRSGWKKKVQQAAQRTDLALPFYPKAFGCLEWINVVTADPADFQTDRQTLARLYQKDATFFSLVNRDIESFHRKVGPDTVAFILEEIVGTHRMFMGNVPLHTHLSDATGNIVLTYPGHPPHSLPYGLEKLQGRRRDLPQMLFICTRPDRVEQIYELQKTRPV